MDLDNEISNFYQNMNDLSVSRNNAVRGQNEVIELLDAEQTRLNTKQRQIDAAIENQKRIIYFNDNTRKINAAYIKIGVTITITLVILWFLNIFNYTFSPPSAIITIAVACVIIIGLVISFNYYLYIRARDNYNFDELKMSPLPINTNDTPAISNPKSGVVSNKASNSCTGVECCSSPTVWNDSLGQCVISNS
jgi:hypothetical protein